MESPDDIDMSNGVNLIRDMMTPAQIRRVRHLLDELERFEHRPKVFPLIREMRALLQPPPTLREIFDRVPGVDVKEKAEKVGIARSSYYKIIHGQVRPEKQTVERLAALSGVPVEVIRASGP